MRALVASSVAALLGVMLAVVVPAVPAYAAFAPSTLAVSKDGRGSVLANNVARFTLTATNPAGAGAKDVYNLTLRDVLDPGVTYLPGSTVPADLGGGRSGADADQQRGDHRAHHERSGQR